MTQTAILDAEKLEAVMLNEPQADCPVRHHFAPNVYMREVFMPAGAIVLGHKHKTEHQNILVKGKLIILLDDGTTQVLQAPFTYVSQPNRKLAYILEDAIWLNIFGTNERDIEKLEDTYLDKSPAYITRLQNDAVKMIGFVKDSLSDYQEFLKENNFTQSQIDVIVHDTSDLIDFPYGVSGVQLSKSTIHGIGMFACQPYKEGEFICEASINNKRTPAGRYVNHAKNPNAMMVMNDHGGIDLMCIKDIQGKKGGLLGDEITVDYRDSIAAIRKVMICQA